MIEIESADSRGGTGDFGEFLPGFIQSERAERLDEYAQRADRESDLGSRAFAGLVGVRQRRAKEDFLLVLDVELFELRPRDREGIRRDDLRAGADVGLMHRDDVSRSAQIEFLERAVDVEPPLVKLGSDG